MSDFCIPIVHVEGSVGHKEYGIADLSDAIYFVQAFASNIFQECFILFAVKNSILQPIHIQVVTEPQNFVPYRLCTQKMYRTAVASNADAVILLHNSPVHIADTKKDITVYKEVKDIGDKIGIPLVDYVVLTGGMLCDIYEKSLFSTYHWNGLKITGCTVCKQLFRVNSEDYCIVSAYQPEKRIVAADGEKKFREKPFTVGV